MHDSLDAVLVDPFTGQLTGTREYLSGLLDTVEPASEKLGCQRYFQFARRMLEMPSESAWQLQRAGELGGDLRALELEISDRTVRDDITTI
jgi:gamma-glutamyl:cysteine ligase YbdK (ATP-grasp superfamily)